MVGGTACIGKSSLATQLAERLNLSTVLKTGIINELVHDILQDDPTQAVPLSVKSSRFSCEADLIEAYKKECLLVKRGLDVEFKKCFQEGKSIIVEGMHMNPEIYSSVALESRLSTQEGLKDSEEAAPHLTGDELPKTTTVKSIVVAFLLTLDDEKLHRDFVTNWVRGTNPGPSEAEFVERSLSNFRKIQDLLVKNRGEFTIFPLNVQSEAETLEHMHSMVLQYMQAIYDRSAT